MEDRVHPLILTTHRSCNNAHHLTDDQMGQLVAFLHGKAPAERSRPIGLTEVQVGDGGSKRAVVTGVNLDAALWRWIRGFHAALYQQLLGANVQRSISSPLQRGAIRANRILVEPVRIQHYLFTRILKLNVQEDNCDEILANRGKHADPLATETIRAFRVVAKRLRQILTYDNGTEFAEFKRIASQSGFDIYFARPYSIWQRGCNENINDLLRQFFPKGADFRSIDGKRLAYVVRQLNNRPRKRLAYRTPSETFNQARRVALVT